VIKSWERASAVLLEVLPTALDAAATVATVVGLVLAAEAASNGFSIIEEDDNETEDVDKVTSSQRCYLRTACL
jgi:hypothetical protein